MSGNPKITAHTLVKNEARWIWFALNSVLEFVDEIMVWDTGSTDETVNIIKTINHPKIKLKEIGSVDASGHTAARGAMLDETDSDWILILDGDEIWYNESLKACISQISNHKSLSALISPFINLVGDIFHFQKSSRSHYRIGPYSGSYNIRFINRRIPGLHVAKPHGGQEYRNADGIALQNLPAENLELVNAPYLHTTHLQRSAKLLTDRHTLKRDFKYRLELGRRFAPDFVYPEALYLPRPEIVPDPWTPRTPGYVTKSMIYEPARFVKNSVIKNQEGY